MENKLKCYPVMLPASNGYYGNCLVKDKEGKIFLSAGESPRSYDQRTPQHLYLVSDREIKKYEWFYAYDRKSVHKNEWNDANALKKEFPFYYKIEATTDPSLGLPLIPQSFIEEWVAKQGKIKEVYIRITQNFLKNEEWEIDFTHGYYCIILPVKESWNREEVKKVYSLYSCFIRERVDKIGDYLSFNEWFDKNY